MPPLLEEQKEKHSSRWSPLPDEPNTYYLPNPDKREIEAMDYYLEHYEAIRQLIDPIVEGNGKEIKGTEASIETLQLIIGGIVSHFPMHHKEWLTRDDHPIATKMAKTISGVESAKLHGLGESHIRQTLGQCFHEYKKPLNWSRIDQEPEDTLRDT